MFQRTVHDCYSARRRDFHLSVYDPKRRADWENVRVRHCLQKLARQDQEHGRGGRFRIMVTLGGYFSGGQRQGASENIPKAFPRTGGCMAESGTEGNDEEDGVRRVGKNAVLTANLVDFTISGD